VFFHFTLFSPTLSPLCRQREGQTDRKVGTQSHGSLRDRQAAELTEQTKRASDRRDDVAQNIRINVRKRHALLRDVEIEWQ
jgi:hypothetical protein